MALRTLLEGEVAALASSRSVEGEPLQLMDRLSRVGFDATDPDGLDTFLEANRQFHLAIAKAADNERMRRVLERALEHCERLLRIGFTHASDDRDVTEEHQQLVNAIMRADPRQARELAEAHARSSQAMILAGLLSTPSLLSASIDVGPPTRLRPISTAGSPGVERA
jgi:DNA-binding GntR family transcriptional regulator